MTDRYERLNRLIDDLLANRAPMPYVAEDEDERLVLEMAAQLPLLRPGRALPAWKYVSALQARLGWITNPRPRQSRRQLLFSGAGGLAAGLVVGLGWWDVHRCGM